MHRPPAVTPFPEKHGPARVPVTRVEVSLSGAVEWREARLEPPLGLYQWHDWSFESNATTLGRRAVRVHATDATGNGQPEAPP